MSKKVIGALLALALVLSVFSFSVFAAGTGYDNDPSHTQTWGFANKTGSDGTYTVEVLLTTTYDVGPLQFQLEGVDKVTKVEPGSGYYPATAYANESGLISIIPDTSSTVAVKTLKKAVVAKVTYTSASNANVTIKNEVKSASKPQGTLMAAFADGNGYLNGSDFLVGQKAEIYAVGEEMPDVPTEAADLAVKAGVTGVIVDKTYTFGGTYAGVVYGFAATDNTTLGKADYLNAALEASDGSALTIDANNSRYGTGTTVTVGTKKYVVIIFGDVDGNGRINASDQSSILAVSKKVATLTGIYQMAAQTNKTTNATQNVNIQGNDYSAILSHNKKVVTIDQAAYAANFNSKPVDEYK